MTSIANAPIRTLNERIEDIMDLQTLKKYSCLKNMHKPEWYMECVECKEKDHCRAGKQAVFILNNATSPEKKEEPKTEVAAVAKNAKKSKEEIEALFSSEDPVKTILEVTLPGTKSQSLYNRIYVWEKHYPDLKEKYHVLDQFRFLFKKPYDRMTAAEILETLYPEKEEKQMNETQDDVISLEDFLNETESTPKTKPAVSEKFIPVPPRLFTEKKEEPKKEAGDECSRMEQMLVKLENEKKDLAERIRNVDKQIEAIHIVQSLIG